MAKTATKPTPRCDEIIKGTRKQKPQRKPCWPIWN